MFSNWVLSGRSFLQRGSRATTSAAGAILATVQHQSASSSSSGKNNRHSSTKVVSGREALLYTPGPLTTSSAVKQAMLRDYGSRDPTFIRVVSTPALRSKHLVSLASHCIKCPSPHLKLRNCNKIKRLLMSTLVLNPTMMRARAFAHSRYERSSRSF